MKNKSITLVLAACCPLLVTGSLAMAGELPPAGSKPLSAIIQSVEGQKAGVVTSSEFDDGLWEVKVCEGRACNKLYIDPTSGAEQRRRKTDADELPPAHAKPLSAIVRSIEGGNTGIITEIEFDDGFWEAELRHDGRKIKLEVDPATGLTRR
jgi:hypothetical protein